MKHKYTLAVFDFDGTITKRDTFNDLIIREFGWFRFIIEFLKLLPLILLYLTGLVPNHIPKQRLFSHFFSGCTEEKFKEICNNYSLKQIDNITKDECMKKIKWHKGQGHKLIVVSASVEGWIKPWAKLNLFDDVISTAVEVKNGVLTGDFGSKNCHGKEKVNRLLEKYPRREEYFLYAYGDSAGDNELLKLADIGFYRCYFRKMN